MEQNAGLGAACSHPSGLPTSPALLRTVLARGEAFPCWTQARCPLVCRHSTGASLVLLSILQYTREVTSAPWPCPGHTPDLSLDRY